MAPHNRIKAERVHGYDPGREYTTDATKRNTTPGAPNHNTTIHKIEIIVNSNQDPSRIARLTVEELGKIRKSQTTARGIPGFLARQ